MIKSVVIESGSCGEVAADQELPSYQVLAALVVSLRGELARAQQRIAELEDRAPARRPARPSRVGTHSSTRRSSTGRPSRKTSSPFTPRSPRPPRSTPSQSSPGNGHYQALGERVGGIRAFLRFDREIRTIICTTNAIESINARLRRAVNARGHLPTGQAALKCLYLALMSLDPDGKGRKRWSNRWKAALNAFDVTFDGRLSAGRK
jgi:hypothetical protein